MPARTAAIAVPVSMVLRASERSAPVPRVRGTVRLSSGSMFRAVFMSSLSSCFGCGMGNSIPYGDSPDLLMHRFHPCCHAEFGLSYFELINNSWIAKTQWCSGTTMLFGLSATKAEWHDQGMVVTIIIVLLIVVGYVGSLVVHPFRICKGCKGTGRHRGTLFTYSHRQCTSCGGQGRHRRLGTVLISRRRPVWGERSAANARDNRWNRPR